MNLNYRANEITVNMMRYHLLFDKELKELRRNKKRVKVFYKPLSYAMGQFFDSVEHIMEIDECLQTFQDDKVDEAIFVFLLKVMDHWVTFIAHKEVDDSPYTSPWVSIDYKEN